MESVYSPQNASIFITTLLEWILVRVDRDALDFLLCRKGFKECTVQKPPISVFCVVSFGQWCLSSEFPRHAY